MIDKDDEVRGLPVNRTTDKPRTPEDEELFKSLIQTMCEVGKRAKEVKPKKNALLTAYDTIEEMDKLKNRKI